MRKLHLLLPAAALLALLPLLSGGWTCGVDLPFHTQSWIDAAQQFRHGVLYPRWTFAAAYNAGEPRFTFYPPLSWMLGGVLTMLLPITAVSKVFAWLVLSLAGYAMYRLVLPLSSPGVAFVSGCLYLANPFMLYTVAMRGACGELLVAACCPLLFAAMLADQPRASRIGVTLAFFWFSNVPGAVIGMYLYALLAAIRLGREWFSRRGGKPWGRFQQLARTFAAGAAFGLTIPAVFLVPALWERRLIRMDDAYSPGMRVFDSLLFQRRLDPVRDSFLIHIEHISLGLVTATLLATALAWWVHRQVDPQGLRARVLLPIVLIAVATAFMLTAPSSLLWKALPELWVTQLPWRVLFVLACCLALGAGCALSSFELRESVAVALSFALVLALAVPARAFRRPGDASDRPAAILAGMERHHTPEPTEEYVLADADAEYMRPDNPPFWLAADPQAFAPGTTPNTTSVDPAAPMPAVPKNARLFATPMHFEVVSPLPQYLVINLQDYPKWHIQLNNARVPEFQHRPDGLFAFAVPAGSSRVDIAWRHTADEWIGGIVSVLAASLALVSFWRGRSPRQEARRPAAALAL